MNWNTIRASARGGPFVCVALIACSSDSPVEPRIGPPSFSVSDTEAPIMPATGVPLTNIYTDAGTIGTPTYPAPMVLVKVTFSGSTKRMYNTDEPFYSPPHTNGEVIGTYGPEGFSVGGSCYYGAVLRYNNGDITPAGGCTGGAGSGSVYVTVSGAGTARRGAASDYHGCGPSHTDHCERFEDQALTVAIEPVRAGLQVSAAPTGISSVGTTTVHFSAVITPSAEAGHAIPFVITSWVFTPEGGGSTQSFANFTSFDWHPQHTGTMCATANVNGATRQRCVRVGVYPCIPTDDSTGQPEPDPLRDPNIRQQLIDAEAGSDENNPAMDQRHERGGMRMLFPDGTVVDTLFEIGPNDDACSFHFPDLNGLPTGTIVVLGWHYHPFHPWPDQSDSLPSYAHCHTETRRRGRYAAPRPSEPDFAATGDSPHIIFDKDHVYYKPPYGDPDQRVKVFRRGGFNCDPLAL